MTHVVSSHPQIRVFFANGERTHILNPTVTIEKNRLMAVTQISTKLRSVGRMGC